VGEGKEGSGEEGEDQRNANTLFRRTNGLKRCIKTTSTQLRNERTKLNDVKLPSSLFFLRIDLTAPPSSLRP
jgi:hypothetical protein